MRREGYSKKSIDSYIYSIGHFLKWMENEVIDVESLVYNDLLDYLNLLQNRNLSGITINSYVMSVQHYLRYLEKDVEIMKNLRVRNRRKRIMTADVIPYEKLEKLYDDFPVGTKHQKRYKAILGLVVFQALNSRDINRFGVNDIDINSGSIYVPSTRTSNSRRLTLNGKQIMSLNVYVEEVRGTFERGREAESSKLFLTSGTDLHMVIHRLVYNLKKIDNTITNVRQIRASVIHHWLHHYNLREVQYRCGHKYVSSTEAYLDSKLEGLEDELMSYHPLG